MNLLQLEYFVAVAKCQHMTRAAEKLHISQPTLSQVIKRLEEELGVHLFERKGKRLQLNEHGKILLERANFILAYIESTKSQFQKTQVKDSNDIYIYMEAGHYIFSDIIKEFNNIYPQIRFHILLSVPDDHNTLSIRYCESWSDTLNSCYLFDDDICLVVTSDSPLAKQKRVNVEQLKNMNFINNYTNFLKDITQPFCERAGFIPHFTYMAFKNEDVSALIESGSGIAFWPKMALKEILTDKMTVCSLQRPVCHRSLFMTFPERRVLTDAESHFVEFTKKYFEHG